MGKYKLLFTILVIAISPYKLMAQQVNYVRTQTATVKNIQTIENLESRTYLEKQESFSYLDGLGRPVQNVIKRASPLGKDIIQIIQYDELGRQDTAYLPYASSTSTGSYRTNALSEQIDFYDGTSTPAGVIESDFPFSVSIFDNSPLNRVIEQGSPGESWQPGEHTVKNIMGTNKTSEVGLWEVNSSGNCEKNGSYPAQSLYMSELEDENGNKIREYKDKQGQVVLKKSYLGTDSLETYYVYDYFSVLRYVLPPKAVEKIGLGTTLSTAVSDSLVFSYQYDKRRRMTEKKLPGAKVVYMVYDTRDRLVLVQDGNQRPDCEWFFTTYDELNRPAVTGIWENIDFNFSTDIPDIEDYENFQAIWDDTNYEYDLSNTLSSGSTVLTETYYDDYEFVEYTNQLYKSLPDSFPNQTEESTCTINKVTGTKIRVLANDTWLTTVNYYDDKGRVIQTMTDNYLGGIERWMNEYDFVGELLKSRHVHYSDDTGNDSLVLWSTFTYDHAGRLLKEYKEIEGDTGNEKVLLAKNDYNELGELMTKNLHATNSQETNYLQEVDYLYNIRGWLTKINDPTNVSSSGDLFGMELLYDTINDLTSLTASHQYNGNISVIKWKGAHYNTLSAYGFEYDDINRLEGADYGTNSGSWTDESEFNVYNLSYDKNGNIENLRRDGASNQIDNLDYQYEGNQLINVEDNATGTKAEGFTDGVNVGDDFVYDDNGNLIEDNNKGLEEITYNELNLPERIIKGNDTIYYLYDASGMKLGKIVTGIGTEEATWYVGEIIYDDSNIDYILTSEGRIRDLGSNNYQYEYFLKDHLGNTRVSFKDSSNVAALNQEFEYYPFGMTARSFDYSSGNKYTYNGKEMQEDLGLDWLDYGARFYDPALGRWHSIDPLAEKMTVWSPYVYTFNNPIYFVDKDGRIPWPKLIESRVYGERTGGNAWGYRIHPTKKVKAFHYGIDLGKNNGKSLKGGENIRSAARGTISYIGYDEGGGNMVVIDHGDGYKTIYMHLQDDSWGSLKKGSKVKNGQNIGKVGNTGKYTTGPHLHFAMKKDGKKMNPTGIKDLDVFLHGDGDADKLKLEMNFLMNQYDDARSELTDINRDDFDNQKEYDKALDGAVNKVNSIIGKYHEKKDKYQSLF